MDESQTWSYQFCFGVWLMIYSRVYERPKSPDQIPFTEGIGATGQLRGILFESTLIRFGKVWDIQVRGILSRKSLCIYRLILPLSCIPQRL
jgi:hypothetical protein